MPDANTREMDSFLSQFTTSDNPPSHGGAAPNGRPTKAVGPLELASDAASVWLAAASGSGIADQFLEDLRSDGDDSAALPASPVSSPPTNGHAAAPLNGSAPGDHGHDDGESAEVELLALEDVAEPATDTIDELVADRELVDVVNSDETVVTSQPLASGETIVEHQAQEATVTIEAQIGATDHLPAPEPIVDRFAEAPVSEPAVDVPQPSHTASSPVLVPSPPSKVLPQHPASGSLFSPYLVTESPALRKRTRARRGFWRRLFGR